MSRLTWRNPEDGKIYLYGENADVVGKLADYEDLEEQCIAENQCGLRELLLKWKEFFDDIAELYEYRKAEEQGLLLRHKLKVGDIVWDNDFGRPCAYQILGFSFGNIDEDVIDDFDFVYVVCKEVIYRYSNLSGSITGYFAESAIGVSMFLTEESALAEKGGAE